MVIVCCLKSLLPLLEIPVCNVAISAQGHQIFYRISNFASTHSSWFYVVDVYGLALTYLTGDEVSCGVAHPFKVDLCVVLHFW